MSLAVRARALALRRVAPALVVAGRRFAPTREHDAHHEDHRGHGPVDTNVYPEDSFRTPIWRNFVLVSVLGVAVAKSLPDDWRENNFLRAWRHHGCVEPEVYRERNVKHLEQSVVRAEDMCILKHAERPQNRRWAYLGYTDSGCQLKQAERLYADPRALDKSKLSKSNDSNSARLVASSSCADGHVQRWINAGRCIIHRQCASDSC